MQPRIIIHGGAGNITHDNLPPALYSAYRESLLRILKSSYALLDGPKAADALTVAVHAVKLLEEDPLFNCGRGAVFTKAGHNELEASIMVTRGHRKRGCAVSIVTRVKSPITLAAEMLRRGDEEGAGGAQGHVHLSGSECERLAGEWGVELCDPKWFWTRKRWEQHLSGGEGIEPPPRDGDEDGDDEKDWKKEAEKEVTLSLQPDGAPWPEDDPAWDGKEYIPKGTVGCVVMDHTGTLAVATSTGGLTNKLSGRIGDTPTFGAGFWAEEWLESSPSALAGSLQISQSVYDMLPTTLTTRFANLDMTGSILGSIRSCFSTTIAVGSATSLSSSTLSHIATQDNKPHPARPQRHAVALGGTGNGDSFLRLSAASTVASLVKFSNPSKSLQQGITYMADPNGQLQQSAGRRWGGKEGEGEGGLIGIEMVDGEGKVCFGFNRAMWRAWVDDEGMERCMVFREEY